MQFNVPLFSNEENIDDPYETPQKNQRLVDRNVCERLRAEQVIHYGGDIVHDSGSENPEHRVVQAVPEDVDEKGSERNYENICE
jgi:hypothetical protein